MRTWIRICDSRKNEIVHAICNETEQGSARVRWVSSDGSTHSVGSERGHSGAKGAFAKRVGGGHKWKPADVENPSDWLHERRMEILEKRWEKL